MIDPFRDKIKFLAPFDGRILTAVSGGVDSVVLVHLLSCCNIPFAIAHCNFSLRGKESDEDEKFVEGLSKQYRVEFHSTRFATGTIAQERNISIQMAARELRYTWFNQIREKYGYAYIATAHHKNDVVETVLLNIIRGTGLSGYHGIREKTNTLLRPLLSFNKEEIVCFAEKNGLKFREDSSNNSEKYSRNLIRRKVVPILKEINPSIENTFIDNTSKILLLEAFVSEKIMELRNSIVSVSESKVVLELNSLLGKPYFHYILFEILKEYGFSWQQILNVNPHNILSGKRLISENYTAFIDRNKIDVQPNCTKESYEVTLPEDIETEYGSYTFIAQRIDAKQIDFTEQNTAFINLDVLRFPLTIRTWKDGDSFQPLGMKNFKKLSDFLIDKKISLSDKRLIPIILSGTDIVWITGLRLDHRFRLLENSTKALKLSFKQK